MVSGIIRFFYPLPPLVDAKAANMAEAYWMSLTRDVPFSKYGEDETTIAAAGKLLRLGSLCFTFYTCVRFLNAKRKCRVEFSGVAAINDTYSVMQACAIATWVYVNVSLAS